MVTRDSRGFTIIEVSLVMGLTFALLTLIGVYFSRGQRYATESRVYSEAQTTATSLLRKMSDRLYHCSYQQRQLAAGCGFFLSYEPIGDEPMKIELSHSGQIAWKKWLGYRFDSATKTVYQGERPLAALHYDLAHPPSPLIDAGNAVNDGTITWKPLPGTVRTFALSTAGQRARIRLTTEAEAPVAGSDSHREVTVSVTGEVALYN